MVSHYRIILLLRSILLKALDFIRISQRLDIIIFNIFIRIPYYVIDIEDVFFCTVTIPIRKIIFGRSNWISLFDLANLIIFISREIQQVLVSKCSD